MIQDLREKRLHASKREWGISRALPVNVFNGASNGLLVDGSCEVGVEIYVLKCENKATALSIEEDGTVCSYVWEIENFSKLVHKLCSPQFTIAGYSYGS